MVKLLSLGWSESLPDLLNEKGPMSVCWRFSEWQRSAQEIQQHTPLFAGWFVPGPDEPRDICRFAVSMTRRRVSGQVALILLIVGGGCGLAAWAVYALG